MWSIGENASYTVGPKRREEKPSTYKGKTRFFAISREFTTDD